jgi:hypothetical protein
MLGKAVKTTTLASAGARTISAMAPKASPVMLRSINTIAGRCWPAGMTAASAETPFGSIYAAYFPLRFRSRGLLYPDDLKLNFASFRRRPRPVCLDLPALAHRAGQVAADRVEARPLDQSLVGKSLDFCVFLLDQRDLFVKS